jgi:hypothetical protein
MLVALLSKLAAWHRHIVVVHDHINAYASEEAARRPNGEAFRLHCLAASTLAGKMDARIRLLRERGPARREDRRLLLILLWPWTPTGPPVPAAVVVALVLHERGDGPADRIGVPDACTDSRTMGLPKLFEASAIKRFVQSNIRLLPVVEGSQWLSLNTSPVLISWNTPEENT